MVGHFRFFWDSQFPSFDSRRDHVATRIDDRSPVTPFILGCLDRYTNTPHHSRYSSAPEVTEKRASEPTTDRIKL